jgi:hypothetical protein
MVATVRRRHAKASAADKEPDSQSKVESPGKDGSEPKFTAREAGSYIVSMVTELRSIAIAADFRFLVYLLEMAFQEAYRLEAELGREGKSHP